ncbi:DegT/DnrJ/EryC1/StrS family aminotransferase [Wenyingzhuangia sp. IMCC45533]
MIPVTKPFLPPAEEYKEMINSIWERGWLTNMGPLANTLEAKLKKYLKVENLLYVTNGTIALQMAIKALDLSGEIITTPFSFVATTSSIVWEGCKPIFADIDKDSLNIDPSRIESLITKETSAILATHVYGNPCDVLAIEKIAKKHNLKIIYDGAHAFGVELHGKSIFEYGDISTCSLHATKLYHSTEGGFIVTNNNELNHKMFKARNFGFNGPENFSTLGVNGKNSEFHAAMGLVNYNYIESIHQKRKELTELYLSKLEKTELRIPLWMESASKNYSYFPVVFPTEQDLLKCKIRLEENKVFSRRYFYPSLGSSLPYTNHVNLEITDCVSKRVLCLPLYYDLSLEDVNSICELIIEN